MEMVSVSRRSSSSTVTRGSKSESTVVSSSSAPAAADASTFDVSDSRPHGHSPSPPSRARRAWALVRRIASFLGPGHVVAVGYMDPGNWATDIQGGSSFGYSLLTIVLLSSVVAVLVQLLSLRLGVVAGLDLAEVQQRHLPKWASVSLWAVSMIAIIATDLAEVSGAAIALNLLFGLALPYGIAITAFDVLVILLGLQRLERVLEAAIILIVMTLFACFVYLMSVSSIDAGDLFFGFLPSATVFANADALFIAIGIIGATVMPHNLFLHSALARDHAKGHAVATALRYGTVDVVVTLSIAFVVNCAILIVAAAQFNANGYDSVAAIPDAYHLLERLVSPVFATVFAVALLFSGQSSTLTGTMAGQIVADGFLQWHMPAWAQRLTTRLLAILPALIVVLAAGPEALDVLLIVSQVILSICLPFALFPLVYFTSRTAVMGEYTVKRIPMVLGFVLATFLALLNVVMLVQLAVSAAQPPPGDEP